MRHIERTRLLVHLVAIDPAHFSFEELWDAYAIVHDELAAYGEKLASTPELVVLNKIDLLDEETVAGELPTVLEEFGRRGIEPLVISASEDAGLEEAR